LRRVASALSQHLHVGQQRQPILCDHSGDEGATHVSSHFGDHDVQFRLTGYDRGVRNGDATGTFAAEFQRNGEGVALLRGFLRGFDPNLGIEPFGGNVA
jgi:hypothetical protein